MNELISVIMPAYNCDKYIHDAIRSILDQTYKNIELIIINDGSNDNTENIIRTFSDNRIVYIKNNTNIGIIKTLNKGIEAAKGEFIARMDSDDVSLPSRFSNQIDIFRNNRNIDLVSILPVNLIDGKERRTSMYMSLCNEALKFTSMFETPFAHPGVMIRKNTLRKYMYSDNENNHFIEDYDLWLRMLNEDCKCYVINKRLLKYRINMEGVSNQNKIIQQGNYIKRSKEVIFNKTQYIIDDNALKIIKMKGPVNNVMDIIKINKILNTIYNKYKERNYVSLRTKLDIETWKINRISKIIYNMISNQKDNKLKPKRRKHECVNR